MKKITLLIALLSLSGCFWHKSVNDCYSIPVDQMSQRLYEYCKARASAPVTNTTIYHQDWQ